MSSLRLVRGTHDLIGSDAQKHQYVIELARSLSSTYGFQEIITPIIEFSSVFLHSLGESSDIVTKEMFTLVDRKTGSASDMVLRPEGTAGTMRAILMNTAGQAMPQKYFYAGPLFRYERPQKGRLRQFHQVGVETVGSAEPMCDIETIALGHALLKAFGLENVSLQLNTLGDDESRKAYHGALVHYLKKYENELSEDSKIRLEKNPLRILDSKDEADKKIVADAPSFSEYLNTESKTFFDEVQQGLTELNIPFVLNERLVRGLDYYCHTAFEFVSDDLGAQGTVLAGGRYDQLTKIMGGPQLPGIGWAAGVERICLLLQNTLETKRPVSVIPISDGEKEFCFKLAQRLRGEGIATDFAYKGNVKARMKKANAANACYAIMIGEDEIKSNKATVRHLDTGDQQDIPMDTITSFLKDHTL